MFCTIRAGRDRHGPGLFASAGLIAIAALVASAQAAEAQEQDNIFKQGAKLLGFATDVAPPPEPAVPALKDIDLKAVKTDLDSLQKRHDALRQAYPPAAKALADQEAAKKKPKTSAPNAQQ